MSHTVQVNYERNGLIFDDRVSITYDHVDLRGEKLLIVPINKGTLYINIVPERKRGGKSNSSSRTSSRNNRGGSKSASTSKLIKPAK